MTHPEPSVSLRHWERVVASIPRPFKRACHGPPPSGRLHLPQSFHCFGRGRYDVWHDWEESDPKQQEKAAGFGEKQRPNHISGTRYCVHKKDPRRSFCKAPSCKSPEARVSPLQTISERTWLFPRQASGTLVPSANWSLGRPGGSANLPTKIQAVPAAAPPLSLLAALGFICGDNPPPPPPSSGLSSSFHHHSNTLPPTGGYVAKPSHHAIQTRNDPPCNQSSSNLRNYNRKYTATKNTTTAVLQAKRSGNPLAELERKSIGTRELDTLETTTRQRMNLCR